jgi:hypothetical protein
MAPEKVTGSAKPGHLAFRIVLCSLLLILIYAWFFYNQGWVYPQVVIPVFLGGFTAVWKFVLFPTEKETILGAFRSVFFTLLRTDVLGIGAGAFLLLSLLWSSVTVVAAEAKGHEKVQLIAGAAVTGSEATFYAKDGELRFRAFTWPWGRSYRLGVSACPQVAFSLRPWTGNRYYLDELLEACHSVLLRVPVEQHAVLGGGLMRVLSGGRTLVEITMQAGQGAVLLGREVAIPAECESAWKLELAGQGIGDANGSRGLRNWMDPAHANLPGGELRETTELKAEFISQGGITLAAKEFSIGRSAFQDVLLASVR